MNTPPDIFNWQAIVIGTVALLLCLATEGASVVVVMTRLKPLVRAFTLAGRTVSAHVAFFSSVLILLGSHLLQICIWAAFLYYAGTVDNPHTAALLAGSTYTTVGFANDTLTQQWQLRAVIMAVTGLFAFAWSTSILYALSQQVYRSET